MDQMQVKMEKAAGAMDPESFLKSLFPLQSEAFGEMQKAFWNQFSLNRDKT